MKTSELIDGPLDWAVLEAQKPDLRNPDRAGIATFGPLFGKGYKYPCWGTRKYSPSTDWKEGGPIIKRELAGVFKYNKLDPNEPDKFGAHVVIQRSDWREDLVNISLCLDGPTPLIAAMRCFVASKLGDEVEIPKELL